MQPYEKRQHYRIDDRIYFDYRVVTPEELCKERSPEEELLNESGQKYRDTAKYFLNINYELGELAKKIG